MHRALLVPVIAIAVLGTSPAAASTAPSPSGPAGNPDGCVDDVAAGTDLFPDKFVVQHAEHLSITYAETYKVVTVAQVGPDAPPKTYVLVQCGTEAPALEGDLAGATTVEIPVQTIFTESTSHDGVIDVLGLTDRVTGVANGDWVMAADLRERIDSGDVVSFNTTNSIDTELVIASDPDVYITGGYDDPLHQPLAEAGVPVVADVEWLETSPKGWAEWVGLFAALTNTEAAANELYAEWSADYDAAAELAASVDDEPTVVTGDLFEGTWYANGGDGIVAQFLDDAGADYVYDDDEGTGSLQLDIEAVLVDGADADFWLNPTSVTSEEQALSIDSRYGDFAAWDRGGVWTNTVSADPAVTFIEYGPVMIDEYLLDYIKVFHPELAADHEFVFLSRVPSS
jgi:iron complex transport system substrate-binding protein